MSTAKTKVNAFLPFIGVMNKLWLLSKRPEDRSGKEVHNDE